MAAVGPLRTGYELNNAVQQHVVVNLKGDHLLVVIVVLPAHQLMLCIQVMLI